MPGNEVVWQNVTIPRVKLPLTIRRSIVRKLNCKDASILLSRQHEFPLATSEKFWLRVHLYICTGCRNFANNLRLMRAAMRRYLDKDADGK